MIRATKKSLIEKLENSNQEHKLYHNIIPEEYRDDSDIIEIERKIGMRIVGRRGFDVINQHFFVHEDVLIYDFRRGEECFREYIKLFENFDDYYDYLQGDIYNNACYYQCDFPGTERKIDSKRIHIQNAFIDYCIDDYKVMPSAEEKELYDEGEQKKAVVKKWVAKFVACDSFEKFCDTACDYYKASVKVEICFFFWQYIFFDLENITRLEILMKYISEHYFYREERIIYPLCHVYEPDIILRLYDYSAGSKQTCYKHKRRIRQYVESVKAKNNVTDRKTEVFFDTETHFYCEKDCFNVYRYFETFDELVKYRDRDLTNTDLTKDINLRYDFTKCRIDNTTKLPINIEDEYKYIVKKSYSYGIYIVCQEWYNSNDLLVKKYTHEFRYFFDFVSFLKGDLSSADLLECYGLQNLLDVSELNLEDAQIPSSICDKLAIDYNRYFLKTENVKSFRCIQKNEKNTALALKESRELITSDEYADALYEYDASKERIYYISDLHLMHKLKKLKPKSKSDVIFALQNIAGEIASSARGILLIGGDVASDYEIFEMFVKTLRDELNKHVNYPYVFFILGNHELWQFSQCPFNDIVSAYEKMLMKYGMYLIQNSIMYLEDWKKKKEITADELEILSDKEIREKLRAARMIIFGGLGFSGYNEEFNAKNGIYRKTIDRKTEIEQSKKFEGLYRKILRAIPDKRVIVFTHTPMDCWRERSDYHKNYIYVSGHTHRNHFYDDGETRIYADNQIGYSNSQIHLKYFEVENEYDYFADYEDGIYQISGEDYLLFYRGKNIWTTFNRKTNVLYMLKKNGYYCFIHKSVGGSFTIMNGGSLTKLDRNDINYYYDNMERVISRLKSPLDKYTRIQEKIAKEVEQIGGDGTIHGSIVDIDWYNHIYINPVDMRITGYWATDIINKKIYSSVPALLEKECPDMYAKYLKLLVRNSKKISALAETAEKNIVEQSQQYLDTDIYKVSRLLKKMQRLNSNILTVWSEGDDSPKGVEQRKKSL